MKIFLSFLQSKQRHPIPAYDFWEYYIKNGIEEAGYQWDECPHVDWAEGLVPQTKKDHDLWLDETWSKTVAYLNKHPADIFLSYLYPKQIDINAIKRIQNMGIPCVNFFCDNVREFTGAPTEFGVFDLNWVPEYKALAFYKNAKYRFLNLPMPMWVNPRYRTIQPEINSHVTFIGSKDIQRHLLFEDIVKRNPAINIFIYGSGWQKPNIESPATPAYTTIKKISYQYQLLSKYGVKGFIEKLKQRNYEGRVSDELNSKIKGMITAHEYNELTACSMITVGVNRYPSFSFPLLNPGTYSRLRDIEAPMLGACYLTEWTEGLENLYDLHHEIKTYKTAEEFLQKIDELKSDLLKRKQLKINGQRRAITEHSIPASLKKMLCTLGL